MDTFVYLIGAVYMAFLTVWRVNWVLSEYGTKRSVDRAAKKPDPPLSVTAAKTSTK